MRLWGMLSQRAASAIYEGYTHKNSVTVHIFGLYQYLSHCLGLKTNKANAPHSTVPNLDKDGRLLEVDFWKVDFSPLRRYPKPTDLVVTV